VATNWTPAELGSVVAGWFDAAQTSTLTLAGSNVSAMASRVDSFSATPALYRGTNGSPTYTQVSTPTPIPPTWSSTKRNSLPALDFTTTNTNPLTYTIPATYPVGSASGSMVAHFSTTASGYAGAAGYGPAPGWSDFNAVKGKYRQIYWTSGNKPGASVYWGDADISDGRQTATRDLFVYAEFVGGATINARSDGGTTSGFTASVSSSHSTTGTTGILGDFLNGNVSYLQEHLVFTRVLTNAERQRVEGYLAWKWGTTAKLPADHPYKSAAPLVTKTIFLTTGSAWTVPTDWDSANNSIELIGGGAGAGGANGPEYAGGGGAYAKKNNLALTAGASVSYAIGAGGVGGSGAVGAYTSATGGGDTWFSSTGTALAKGAAAPDAAGVSPGPGGASASSVGDTKYSGGTGSYGGGAAAGPGGAGGNGNTGTGAVGGFYKGGDAVGSGAGLGGSTGAGNGTDGTTWTQTSDTATAGPGGGGSVSTTVAQNGGSGGLYGGGGAIPSSTSGAGGNGRQGIIVITYAPTDVVTVTGSSASTLGSVTMSASALIKLAANSSSSLGVIAAATAGVISIRADAAGTLGGFTASTTAAAIIKATASRPAVFDFTAGTLDAGATVTRAAGSWSRVDATKVVVEGTAADTARFDYHPVTGSLRGLLLEPASTNYVSDSADFAAVGWSNTNVVVTANSQAGPTGSATADKLVANTTNASHTLNPPATQTFAAGDRLTKSIFIKDAGARYIGINSNGAFGAAGRLAIFDLQTLTAQINPDASGIPTTGGSTQIDDFGGGFYRLTLTTGPAGGSGTTAPQNWTLAASATPPNNGVNPSFAGDGVNGVYAWGAQSESGSRLTSYIPTSGGIATRPAETLVLDCASRGIVDGSYTALVTFDDLSAQVVPITVASGTASIAAASLSRNWVRQVRVPAGGSDLAGVLDGVASAGTSQARITATLAGTLDPITAAGAGAIVRVGTGASTVGDVTASAAGKVKLTGASGPDFLIDFAATPDATPYGVAVQRAAGPWTRTNAGKLMERGTDANTVRHTYDPLTGAYLGVYLEPQRTNYIDQAENQTTRWGVNDLVWTADVGLAPDGTTTADKMQAGTAGTAKQTNSPPNSVAVAIGQRMVKSAWITPAGWSIFGLGTPVGTFGSTGRAAQFNVSTGATVTDGGACIAGAENWGSAGYRIALTTAPAIAAVGNSGMGSWSMNGTYGAPATYVGANWASAGTEAVYFACAQTELVDVGSYAGPTSYIPSNGGVGTNATRPAETLLINGVARGIPDGTYSVTYTFDDLSTQTTTMTVTAGVGSQAATLNRLIIRSVQGVITGPTLGSITIDAQGGGIARADATATLGAITTNAEAVIHPTGAVNSTLDAVTGTATAVATIRADVAQPIGPVVSSGGGASLIVGSAAPVLSAVLASSSAALPLVGNAAATLADVTSTGQGRPIIHAEAGVTLGGVAGSATARAIITGTVDTTFAITTDATATITLVATVTTTLGAVGTSAAGGPVIAASAAPALDAITTTATSQIRSGGQVDSMLGDIIAQGAAAISVAGSGASILLDVTAEFTGTIRVQGAAAAQLGGILVETSGGPIVHAVAAAELDAISTGATAKLPIGGSLSVTVGAITGTTTSALRITADHLTGLDSFGMLAEARVLLQAEAAATLDSIGSVAVLRYVPRVSCERAVAADPEDRRAVASIEFRVAIAAAEYRTARASTEYRFAKASPGVCFALRP
jgi:hypothetical protein